MNRSARRTLTALAVTAALAGCVTYKTRSDGVTRLRLGETGVVDGPRVTPLTLIEDSRCPAGVQCIWAGRVRITARIETGAGSEVREMTMGEGQHIADGELKLIETWPGKKAKDTIYPEEYRFGFKFDGGL